jgi:DNA helicase HerA-like ATPase
MRDLAGFGLFWEHGSGEPPIRNLAETSLVIDLSNLHVLRELVAYVVIEQLYREMCALPDSAVAEPYREIRTILVIDEAHHYLGQDNLFLQLILREGRSKGVAVFFASQSPADYAPRSSGFDYAEQIEFPLIFGCDAVSARRLRGLVGCSQRAASSLSSQIAHLKRFEFVTKTDETPEGCMVCRAEPFYQVYG